MKYSEVIKFCGRCGSNTFPLVGERHFHCNDCDFDYFYNVASAGGVFIENEKGQLLLLRRANDPGRGLWDIAGGYQEIGETIEEGQRREVMEEVGIALGEFEYFGSFPNAYDYKDMTYDVLDFYFIAQAKDEPIAADPKETLSVQWFDVQDIPMDSIALTSVRNGLQAYQQYRLETE